MLLPYVEQTALYDHCDFSLFAVEGGNVEAIRTPLSVFRCSSFPGPTDQTFTESFHRIQVTVPHASYGRNDEIPPNAHFRDVTDGLSATIMLGEKARYTMEILGYKLHWSTTWSSAIDGREGSDLYFFNPEVDCGAVVRPEEGSPGFASSYHPGGAQFALFDGSARFISETTDAQTMANLAALDDGNPVGPF